MAATDPLPDRDTAERIPLLVPDLRGNEAAYLAKCIEDGWVSSAGSYIGELEARMAALAGCRYGVATSSGTTALHLTLVAAGVGPGDRVIVPDWTFAATANAVYHTGATPYFVDIAADTWSFSAPLVEELLSDAGSQQQRIAAVICVHALGHPAELDPLIESCRAAGVPLIEDAACAVGATYRQRPAGGLGDAAVSDVPLRYYTGDPDGEVHISGVPVDDLVSHGIPRGALEPYMPMPSDRVREAGIEVHYLGHFLRWTPQECYYYAAEHIGFEANSERTDGTYSKYNSIDDRVDGFHYWTGFVKFGIGRCTHEASQEIRHGHITREEGVALVHKFDGEFPNAYFRDVLEYLDMEEDEFLEIADRFRSPHLWKKTNEGWALRFRVT